MLWVLTWSTYSFEVPHQGTLNVYPKHMFSWKNVSIFRLKKKFPYLELCYCPFGILWKDVFGLPFYSKWECFVLTDHILLGTICLSCFCSLFSNITVKLILRPKMGLTYAMSVVNWTFLTILLELSFFSLSLNKWCSITVLWKFQKIWTSGTCWKSASKLTYPIDFCIVYSHFYYGKKWK